jgi:Bacterial Ig-like domain (group 3)/FG-GAP-like repeat
MHPRHPGVLLALTLLCLAPAALAQTTTTLTITSGGSAVTTVPAGSVVTLTATVTSGGVAVKPGQVNFCNATAPQCTDIHLLGTSQLTFAGTAVMKFVPGVGSHSYRAVFPGTTSKAASSSAASPLVVTAAYSTTTTLASSGSAGNYILTATVTTSGGTVTPTGAISFVDTSNANYILQTAPLAPVTSTLSFVNSSTLATNPYPQSVGVADFNGDGELDLAVPTYSGNTNFSAISIELGNGGGTFTSAPTLPLLSQDAGSVAMADFNGDGKPDIVVTLPDTISGASGTLNEMQVMLGNGDGTFTTGQNISIADPFFVTTGDFNGDGIPDLAVANSNKDTVTILLGIGDGTFTLNSNVVTGIYPISIAVGDFNADGKLDLAVANYGNDSAVVLLGNGDGTFQPPAGNPMPVGGSPESIAVGDFNGDGNADLAIVNSNVNTARSGTLTILLGNGNGTFTQAPVSPATGNLPYSVAVADFNGDGKADLVTANNLNLGTVSVLLGNGDSTFATAINPFAGNAPVFAAVGDFNGDGLADIAAADNNASSVYVLLSQPGTETATATVNGISPVGTGTHLINASYPGDAGYLPSASTPISLTAEQVPTTLTLTATPASITFGQQIVLTAILTPNAAQDHNTSGIVTFTSGATTLGTGAIVNGIATLNTTVLPNGADSLTASYAGDTNFLASTSAPVTVNVVGRDFTITLANPTLTTPSQHTLTTTVTLTSINDFADSLALSCTNLPAYITCLFAPATVTLAANNTTTSALTLTISAIPTHARDYIPQCPSRPTPSPIDSALLLSPTSLVAGFAALRIRRKSGRSHYLLLILAAVPFTLALSGCDTLILTNAPTSTTYTIPITATGVSTGVAHSAQLTLTVTP